MKEHDWPFNVTLLSQAHDKWSISDLTLSVYDYHAEWMEVLELTTVCVSWETDLNQPRHKDAH